MIDHRMDGVPGPAEGRLFARCSPPPLCPLSSSSSAASCSSNSSSSDPSPASQSQSQSHSQSQSQSPSQPLTPGSKAALRELTFPPFPSFHAAATAGALSSPPFGPRLVSASSLSFQSSNPFVLPPSSSPSAASASSPSASSASSASHGGHGGLVSAFCVGSSLSFPGLSRLYSGTSLSGGSDADSVLMDAPYMASFSSADFALRLPLTACDAPSLAQFAALPGPPSPPLGPASLSASRSISSASASSSPSLASPHRPRCLASSGGEREDGLVAAAANSDSSTGLGAGSLWHCSYGCGKVYRKSSGRSIRRHVVSCFKVHWPGGAELSDGELSSLIALQQDRGLLVTGLRRWKMRQSRRPANELTESEKWRCPWNCGKFYRSTSSRSIQRHATTCPNRAADHGSSPSSDAKRVKRQRDEGGQDDHSDDGALRAEDCSESDGNDNDEAEETTDSSGSARSGKGRARATSLRSSHSHSHSHSLTQSSGSSNRGKAALQLNTQLTSPTWSSSSSSSTPQHPAGQSNASALSYSHSQSQDVDFLYPDSSTPSPSDRAASAAAASAPHSYDELGSQKREVALQLQHLLRDIHRRHGTNHPVFQSPMMTPQLIAGLLNKDVDTAVDDMDTDQLQQPPHAAAAQRRSLELSVAVSDDSDAVRRGSWAAGGSDSTTSLMSPSSVSSAPSTPSVSSASLQWTCACGSSFKITSSKSIQKHRASCDTHRTSSQHQHSHSHSHSHAKQPAALEPRVKREKH